MFERLKEWAVAVKRDVHALYLASRDPRVPYHVKILAAAVAAYALSPIDLIPDFIPVLGLIDDAIILPLGILLVIRLIPTEVMAECRSRSVAHDRPANLVSAVLIVGLWLAVLLLSAWTAYRWSAEESRVFP